MRACPSIAGGPASRRLENLRSAPHSSHRMMPELPKPRSAPVRQRCGATGAWQRSHLSNSMQQCSAQAIENANRQARRKCGTGSVAKHCGQYWIPNPSRRVDRLTIGRTHLARPCLGSSPHSTPSRERRVPAASRDRGSPAAADTVSSSVVHAPRSMSSPNTWRPRPISQKPSC